MFGLSASLLVVGSVARCDAAIGGTPGGGAPPGASAGLEAGFIPASVPPNGAVTERELASLGARLAGQFGSESARPIEVLHPLAPVNRLRVLVALVKLGPGARGAGGGDAHIPGQPASEKMPPDAADIPAWGAPYVAAAVEQGWWPGDRPLHARDVATWTFVQAMVTRMFSSSPPDSGRPVRTPLQTTAGSSTAPAADGSGAYTGLVLDARGLELQRTMGPRIVDEDGQLLYPDPTHVPDMTFLQDHGMVAYVKDGGETPRSGSHPLLVPTLSVTGQGHVDLVVSRETARQVREADARGGFLSRWAVSILIGAR